MHLFGTPLMCFCRECWPSDERFGGADMPPEEEFMLVRNLFMTEAESTFFLFLQLFYWDRIYRFLSIVVCFTYYPFI